MHIALLTGGISTERPISLRSSEGLKAFIAEAGHTYDVYDIPAEIDEFLAKYQSYDIVFPYLHGRYGEDGVITGLCETLGIRYIGSPATTHALCIDKFRTNCVVEKLGIVGVPKSWIPGMSSPKLLGLPEVENILPSDHSELPAPVIVKPNCGGSTVATNKAKTVEKLANSIQEVYINTAALTTGNVTLLQEGESKMKTCKNEYDEEQVCETKGAYSNVSDGGEQVKGRSQAKFFRVFPDYTDQPIVQEYIEGDEYTVGVTGPTNNPETLPIMQIVNIKAELFDWQEKYESDGSNEIFAKNIDPELKKNLESITKKIYTQLGCSGVARIDYRVRGNDIFFLEVNTFPGATQASFIPKMWRESGRTMGEFVEMLITTATK